MKILSQRTIVRMMETLEEYSSVDSEMEAPINFSRLLYEHDFPEWFVTHAESYYTYNWDTILRDLRNTQFFFPESSYSYTGGNILGEKYLSQQNAAVLGEAIIQRLAALLASSLQFESVRRSLELDGFAVNKGKLELTPLEGPVSQEEEQTRFTQLLRQAALPREAVIRKHLEDAADHYANGKDHSCLGESRSFLQALIDDICTETHNHAGLTIGLPGGTKNRIEYLQNAAFLTADEAAAYGSAWGTLSAGAHPGVPARDHARIAMILALESGQLLLLKFIDWKGNQYRRFSSP